MQRLRAADVRAILGFLATAYAVPRGDFRLGVLEQLRRLVPSDMTAWVETRIGRPEVVAIASPCDFLPDGPRRFAAVRDEHPVLAYFEASRRGNAMKLSDFLGRTQYHRRRIYQEFFRPAGVEHQMSIALPSAGERLVRITLNRAHRDFDERDRQVLDLVRPHLAQACENAAAFARIAGQGTDIEQAADMGDVGVVRVRSGHAVYASRRARTQLVTYFDASPAWRGQLPDALSAWLGIRSDEIGPPHGPLVVERPGGRLAVRRLSDERGDLLVLQEARDRVGPVALESLGLTRRQAEVLAWMVHGKTNAEIASILAISPHTVARHVEAVYARLGVQTRTAAVATAFTHVGCSSGGVADAPPDVGPQALRGRGTRCDT